PGASPKEVEAALNSPQNSSARRPANSKTVAATWNSQKNSSARRPAVSLAAAAHLASRWRRKNKLLSFSLRLFSVGLLRTARFSSRYRGFDARRPASYFGSVRRQFF